MKVDLEKVGPCDWEGSADAGSRASSRRRVLRAIASKENSEQEREKTALRVVDETKREREREKATRRERKGF
jgi:hypothetical protein